MIRTKASKGAEFITQHYRMSWLREALHNHLKRASETDDSIVAYEGTLVQLKIISQYVICIYSIFCFDFDRNTRCNDEGYGIAHMV